jgi:tetratricopeptide (TPR) repeat protein
MNHPDFTELRRAIDAAITYDDPVMARHLTREGERRALALGCPGEHMYFKAQYAIIDGRYEEAVPYLQEALMFNPDDGAAYNDLALCLVERGVIEGVLEIFDQGIAVEPDYATIHHNKGWLLNQLNQPLAALECFRRALALEPGRAVTYENMANAYEMLGRAPEAVGAYAEALRCLKQGTGFIRSQIEGEIERLRYA